MNKVCGLDVHKRSLFACVLDEKGEIFLEEKFGTLTSDLDKLRKALVEYGVERVAMESTNIYWMPVCHVLESDFELKLANPYFIKQLPGRKSDVEDAHWITTALQKELIKDCYVSRQRFVKDMPV